MTFSIKDRIKSFQYAFTGIYTLIKTQHNAWIHLVITIIVITLGIYLDLSKYDWCWLIVSMTIVWMAEAFNTSIEYLADHATQEQHELIKKTKDLAAGAVLISAIGATIIGIIIIGIPIYNKLF